MDFAERMGRVNVAKDATMVQHVAKLLKLNRESLGQYRRQLLGQGETPTKQAEDDDMMILGDVTISQPEPSRPPEKSGGSRLAKIAGIAALALGSGGVGAAGALLPSVLGLLGDDVPEVRTETEEKVIERESREDVEVLPPIVRPPDSE